MGLTLELWDCGTLELGRVTEDWSESMAAVLGQSEILQRNQVNYKNLYSTPTLTAFAKKIGSSELEFKIKTLYFLESYFKQFEAVVARTHSS